jgi:cardiolipin synthase (CMP-forming)
MNSDESKLSRIFKDRRWFNISNVLTLIRILLAPVIVVGIYNRCWFFSFIIFVLAFATDLLDGYLARLLQDQTHLGQLLDPLADKLFLMSSFGALVLLGSPSFHIPKWFLILAVSREVVLVLGSFLLLCASVNVNLEPLIWGKLTTLFQALFILWIFFCYFFGWEPARTYDVLLVLLSLFSVISLFQYIRIKVKILSR